MKEVIAGCCTRALLAEVCATPKPGLVDKWDSGAHRDMDIRTFFHSAAVLAPYFRAIAEEAMHSPLPDKELLPSLREIGAKYEKKMLCATNGVNTHKGAVYSMGLVAAAAGRCLAKGEGLSAEAVSNAVSRIAASESRLPMRETGCTNGQKAYRDHRITGARGEAAAGFPSVMCYALPVLRGAGDGPPSNEDCLQALLALMGVVDDTNVVARGGVGALEDVKAMARACMTAGGAYSQAGMRGLVRMNTVFVSRNLSPGGSADLLAVAIALHLLEHIAQAKGDRGHGYAASCFAGA